MGTAGENKAVSDRWTGSFLFPRGWWHSEPTITSESARKGCHQRHGEPGFILLLSAGKFESSNLESFIPQLLQEKSVSDTSLTSSFRYPHGLGITLFLSLSSSIWYIHGGWYEAGYDWRGIRALLSRGKV